MGEIRLVKYGITKEPIVVQELIDFVQDRNAGAINLFIGTVRELTNGKKTFSLEYQAYDEMAEKKLKEIGDEILTRFPQTKVALVHRIGHLEISDIAVVIAVSTPHRSQSFDACRYAIERIKQVVPIWKKEISEQGQWWIGG